MALEIGVSFEFFPPKSPTAEAALWTSIERLAPLVPNFMSVTYGAGGSTRARTHAVVAQLASGKAGVPAAHLTCVGASRHEVDAVARDYWEAGVRHIVALRGDPAGGMGARYEPHPDGYAYAVDLVAGLRRLANFEISVAGYPECHPESVSWERDIDILKRKVDAGASRVITQFFFDNDAFERYADRISAAGIAIPVVPGMLPIHSFSQVAGFASRAGVKVPAHILDRFSGLENDEDMHRLVAAAVCAEQVMDLVRRGVTDFHFYTMNRSELTHAICRLLGLRPVMRRAA